MLSLKNFSVSVEKKKIIKDINFEFEKGKIYALMGPNGSGKSTFAYSITGHPAYSVEKGSEAVFEGEDIVNLSVDKRSVKGIFLSFQNPLSILGVKLRQFLYFALQGKKDPLTISQEIKKYAKDLKISDDLLNRSLNEGASGGEKKKLEVLQAAVLDKKLIIFDEVDTGVDVDALKTIAQFLRKNKTDKTYIIITHYNRILKYLKPDHVIVLNQGVIKKVGDHTLAYDIEKNGYGK
ncbi:MAG: Fe-S cluster assembly ATPase SufC [Candidatus Roizmanbacteria bacterium]|nr:MAG: Fe-S cluster assembly ATPase SufC [Candidatus Roizmanbacteria bacterium]